MFRITLSLTLSNKQQQLHLLSHLKHYQTAFPSHRIIYLSFAISIYYAGRALKTVSKYFHSQRPWSPYHIECPQLHGVKDSNTPNHHETRRSPSSLKSLVTDPVSIQKAQAPDSYRIYIHLNVVPLFSVKFCAKQQWFHVHPNEALDGDSEFLPRNRDAWHGGARGVRQGQLTHARVTSW